MDIQTGRTMSDDALEALDEILRAAFPMCEGLSRRKGYVFVHVSKATPEEQAAIVNAVLSHDSNIRTARQMQEYAAAIAKHAH